MLIHVDSIHLTTLMAPGGCFMSFEEESAGGGQASVVRCAQGTARILQFNVVH